MDRSLLRRFSFGGYSSELRDVAVWKFDVLLRQVNERSLTCYIGHAARGEALQAFFAKHPGACIFGTGLPLTDPEAKIEIGRTLDSGEILLVDDTEQ